MVLGIEQACALRHRYLSCGVVMERVSACLASAVQDFTFLFAFQHPSIFSFAAGANAQEADLFERDLASLSQRSLLWR
jgi:hypothetical protein